MILWMVWTLAISGLLAISATLLSRVASYVGMARRFVWIAAMLAAVVAPFLLPSRTFSLRSQSLPIHPVA